MPRKGHHTEMCQRCQEAEGMGAMRFDGRGAIQGHTSGGQEAEEGGSFEKELWRSAGRDCEAG